MIVAACNEGAQIGSALKRLRHISQESPLEVIVVDGGSNDDTAAQARDWADTVLTHDRDNRGEQFHMGALKAAGELLLFLRADAQPPGNWQQALEHFWLSTQAEGVAATAFSVDYGNPTPYRLAAGWSNAVARWSGRAEGDHGLCTTPDLYRRAGGFPPYPCMEDLAFCDRLLELGSIVLLRERIWSAARRMHQVGAFRSEAHQAWLRLRYRLGASPETLRGR